MSTATEGVILKVSKPKLGGHLLRMLERGLMSIVRMEPEENSYLLILRFSYPKFVT